MKAVGAALNPESPEFHRREAVVSAALPPTSEFPRLLDVYDDGDWVALAFEAIDGGPPAHPWDRRQLEAAVQALDALHDALTPSPVPDAPAAADRLQFLFGGWARAGGAGPAPRGARHLERPPPRVAWPSSSRGGVRQLQGRRCSTATCAPTTS